MPIDTDYRQAIILALQQEGADVASGVIDILRRIGSEQDVVNKQYAEGSITTQRYVESQAKLNSEGDKWRSILRETRDQQDGLNKAMEETLVPLNKLIVDSLKYKDVLEKIADKKASGDSRQQQLKDEADLQEYLGRKTRETAEAIVKAEQAGIDARVKGTMAVREETQSILSEAEAAERARKAFEATIIPVDRLADSLKKVQSDRIDKLASDTEKARRAFEATVIPLEALQNSAKQVKSDGIEALAVAADKASKATNKLSDEAQQKLQSQTRGATRAVLELSRAFEDYATGGFLGIVNNIPGAFGGIAAAAGLAAPQVAAVEAASAVLATTLYALRSVLPDLSAYAKDFAKNIDILRDPVRDATSSLEGMKEVIQALNDKPLKTEADYQALRKLTLESENATRALREWEQLKFKRSDAQQASVDAVQRGVIEGGGKTAVEDAFIEIAKRNGTFAAGSELHGQIAAQQGVIDYYNDPANAGIANVGGVGAIRTRLARDELAKLRDQMEKEGREKIGQMFELGQGEASRKTIQDILFDPANKDILQRHQITNALGLGVVMASPENVQGEKENKRAVAEQQAEAQRAAAERRHRQAVEETNRREQEQAQRQEDQEDARAQAHFDQQALHNETRFAHFQATGEARVGREADAAAKKDAAQRAQAEKEAPRLQRQRDVRDLGREAAGRAAGMDLGNMNAAQAEHAGRKALAMIEGGLDPNTALIATIMEMAQAVENNAAKAQAQVMGLRGVGQRMRALGGNQRRGQARGATGGMTFN